MAVSLIIAVALLYCSAFWTGAAGETCTISASQCQCSLADGRTMDITGMSNSPTFQNFPDKDGAGYTYAYGPCGDVLDLGGDCSPVNDAASCQNAADTWYSLGRTQQLTVDVDTSANPVTSTWHYIGGTDGRESIAKIKCDPNQTPGSITDAGEEPTLTYNFNVESSYGCLRGGSETTQPTPPSTATKPHTSGGGGISPGSVTVIIFFSVGTIYIVGGVLLMKFHRGAQGLEMVPNRELWMSVPGLIKDGVMFIVSPFHKGGREGYEKM